MMKMTVENLLAGQIYDDWRGRVFKSLA